MTVIVKKATLTPAQPAAQGAPPSGKTYAIVIGIGRYGWLQGGKRRPEFKFADGTKMEQIAAPPASARDVASWLLSSYDNPTAPLASVELLLSDDGSQTFQYDGRSIRIAPATYSKVEKAITQWANRATDPDDILLFFWSGHGMASGDDTTLLCEDFGRDPMKTMQYAIDVRRFINAMRRFPARRQIFFIDACRRATAETLESFHDLGQPIFTGKATFPGGARIVSYLNSALAGQAAYAPLNGRTYFTDALLKAFDGPAASVGDDGEWWIRADALIGALKKLLPRVVGPGGVQPDAVGMQPTAEFKIHKLRALPAGIPVDVRCEPDTSTASAVFSHKGGPTPADSRATPSPDPWCLWLAHGTYQFEAAFASGELWTVPDAVYPPGHPVKITQPAPHP